MTSLRSRLILGFAVVAVIPLALAMVLLSQRIQSSVRGQASERLGATLGMLQSQLRADGTRTAEKLRILAQDAQLKRLFLVQPVAVRDLSEYLAEQRFLLGLDLLEVADTSGAVVADGAATSSSPAFALAERAPIRYQGDTVGVVRGGMALDAAFLARLKQTSGVDLVLRDEGGRLVATTLAGATETPPPARGGAALVKVEGRTYWSRSFALEAGPGLRAGITGLVPTAAADQTIAALRWTSALLGLLGLGIAIALGVLWSLQVSRPVEQLARFSERIAQGHWDEPLRLRSMRELATLVAALDRMRADLATYRDKLVLSERQAAWSQMARMVAHEIKNPLTPIAVSVADLQRSFELGRADFPEILGAAARTINEEVESLKRILQEFAEFARLPAPRLAPCRLSELASGLEALYRGEIDTGRLSLWAPGPDPGFCADAGQLRQALVNLIKNAFEAVDAGGRVEVAARADAATVELAVSDTGPPLSPEQRAQLFVPHFTTKPHGSGLGLTIVERIVSDHGGTIAVEDRPGGGTTFRMRFPCEQKGSPCPPS